MSSSSFLTIFTTYITLFTLLHISNANSNQTDLLALHEIKAQIRHDPLGIMSTWNDSLQFCEWRGVFCGHRHKRVTKLDLKSSNLTGFLSPHIGNLSFLRQIFLQKNNFGGKIPHEITNLVRLKTLLLINNSFSGTIPPNISACSNLLVIDISNNQFEGHVPNEFGFLPKLKYLGFSENNFKGNIPNSFGNLSSLSQLYIGVNNLVGKIPDSLGKLTNLTIFATPLNMLSGRVPTLIFNLSSLNILDLGSNNLEGNLPSSLDISLPNLMVFSIGTNRFIGSFPSFICNSSNLEYLQVNSNNLQGQIPSLNKLKKLTRLALFNNSFGFGLNDDLNFISSLEINASMLFEFDISSNNFHGVFPTSICNFSMLSYLKLEHNMITGKIPNCIGNLKHLLAFNVWGNQLSGIIPESIGKLHSLRELDLSINQISGNIPLSIGNLTNLILLQLSQTNLKGRIPLALGQCTNLQGLDLSQNNLSGRIPTQILILPNLNIALYLNNNNLSGPLPEEIGQLKNLEQLDISTNSLSGEIPNTIGACVVLDSIYMNRNLFQGTIPDSLKTLKGLRELDLSYNNFSSKIPTSLASLPLQLLNLSYNSNLEGEVPSGGVFNNITGFSIIGNNRLCGGISELKLPKCNYQKIHSRKHSHMRVKLAIIFGFLGGLMILALVLILLYTLWYKKRPIKLETADNNTENFPNLSYQTILKASNGFSTDNLIGRGTFGVVYKGILDDQDNKILAIKIFNLEHHGASKSFMAECEALRNIRHRNLVKIITACSSVDYQGNDFKALAYEYMENGSLEDWLHPIEKTSSVESTSIRTSRKLSFNQRINIANDVAFALEYLHHQCGASIIHCDLKPSNVLLDDNMVAHVGDFGLAKILSGNIPNLYDNQSSSLGVRGTIGYAPPEYGLGNEVSTHGDVYSFGILLLELFTGKRPTDDMFNDSFNLHYLVKEDVPQNVTEVLDQTLIEDLIEEETIDSDLMLEASISILEIALSCSKELPQERLDMSEASSKLSSIRNKLLKARLKPRRRVLIDNTQS
ncbi:unnamed protein product [Amaranthus hypochondriacus]